MKEYKPNNHNNQCNNNGIAQPKHTPQDDAEKGFLDKVKWVDRRLALFLFLQNPQRKKNAFVFLLSVLSGAVLGVPLLLCHWI